MKAIRNHLISRIREGNWLSVVIAAGTFGLVLFLEKCG